MYKRWPKSKPQCRRKKSPPTHTHRRRRRRRNRESEALKHTDQYNMTSDRTHKFKIWCSPPGCRYRAGVSNWMSRRIVWCDWFAIFYLKIIVILNQAVTRLLSADVLIGSTSDFSLARATKFTISLARATRYKLFWSWLWAVCKLVMIFICSW